MATKTVVCPECGVAAAPGRYACAECGALLAAVGAMPRSWPTVDPTPAPQPVADAALVADQAANGAKVAARRTAARARRAAQAASPAPSPEALAAVAPPEAELPVAAPPPIAAPPVVAAPAPAIDPPVAPEPADDVAAMAEPAVDDDEIEARRASLAPLAPSWPPPGDRGPLASPVERVPAGAYLAPSAVLPPLDAPAQARNGHREAAGGAKTSQAAPADVSPESPAPSTSLADRLEAFGITAETPRRVAGAGAAIAALGFVLPWRSSPFGGDLIDDYLTHWGLAGPGNWVVVGLLVVLTAIGLTSGRFARLPIGIPSVALATLLVGLLWPSLFAPVAKPVGVWIVLAGALLLAAGGVLAERRHEPAELPV